MSSFNRRLIPARIFSLPLLLALIAGQFASAQSASLSELDKHSLLAPQAVAKFYQESASANVWGNDSDFNELINALEGLEQHGLNPLHYHLEKLKSDETDSIERDIYATDAWFAAAAHMLYGKLDPVSV